MTTQTSCFRRERTNTTNHILKKTNYLSGKVRHIISFSSNNILDSTSVFYNETGTIDSTVNYLNGKRNGAKYFFYNDTTIIDDFHNDTLEKHSIYDSAHVLIYQCPINLESVSKTKFWFSSGRNYFDQSKTDTINIINKGLPFFNKGIGFKGVNYIRITDSSYAIKKSPKLNDLKELKIFVQVYQSMGDIPEFPATKPILFDSLNIEVK